MKSVSTFKNLSEDDIWNSENIYHLKTDITRIPNLINHYELYKKIISLPGDVVECGVFKGISLTTGSFILSPASLIPSISFVKLSFSKSGDIRNSLLFFIFKPNFYRCLEVAH